MSVLVTLKAAADACAVYRELPAAWTGEKTWLAGGELLADSGSMENRG